VDVIRWAKSSYLCSKVNPRLGTSEWDDHKKIYVGIDELYDVDEATLYFLNHC
jgi:hypothetical protein